MRLVTWYGTRIVELTRGTRAQCIVHLNSWTPTTQAEFHRKVGAQIWTEKQANRFRYLDGSHPLRRPQ